MANKSIQVYLLVDASGSMGMHNDTPTKTDRWSYAGEFAFSLAKKVGAVDPDGIWLGVFSSVVQNTFAGQDGVTPKTIAQIWQQYEPDGGTTLAPALKYLTDLALSRAADGPQLILVISDGQPSDQEQVRDTIIAATQRMTHDRQLAIQFAQVGNAADATAFLQFLDDGLVAKGAKFDVVNTTRIEDLVQLDVGQLVTNAFDD